MNFAYPVQTTCTEDGRITVIFKDLPCSVTDIDQNKAFELAKQELEKVIEQHMKSNTPLPVASAPESGDQCVALNAQAAAKAALYVAFLEGKMSKAALARAMKVDNKEIRRMLSFETPTKLPRIVEALNILGFDLTISLEPAA